MDYVQKYLKYIGASYKHAYYAHNCNLASEYLAHMTGLGIEKYLKRYAITESEHEFVHRVAITNAINPSVCNSLIKPFYKVPRNNNVTKRFDFKSERLNANVSVMLNEFEGGAVDGMNGVETWLGNEFVEASFVDPNAFVVLEWEAKPVNELVRPYAVIAKSENVLDYGFKGKTLTHLFTAFPDTFITYEGGKSTLKPSKRYTLYVQGTTYTFTRMEKRVLEDMGYALSENEQIETVNKETYLVTTYNTNLNFVPAYQIGYIKDASTGGRTFVNPFHSAMPYLRKLLKTVSELDITMSSHAFPQKLQYTQKCDGVSDLEPCYNGMCPTTQSPCKSCGGSGVKTVTSAMQGMFLPLPDTKEDLLPLNDLLVYKTPPIDILSFQNEYVKSLKQDAHLSVFNSNMFLASEATIAQTATEVNVAVDSVNDTLTPFAAKFASLWRNITYTFAALAGFDQNANEFDLLFKFPQDFKLKSLSMLIADLQKVNESGAPDFLRAQINDDIASIMFQDKEIEGLKYKTRSKFAPFQGKSVNETQILLSSPYISESAKVLHTNFELIFRDLESENQIFYFLPEQRQRELINIKLTEYIAALSQAPTINFAPDVEDETELQ